MLSASLDLYHTKRLIARMYSRMNWKKAMSQNIILQIVGLTVFFWLYHKLAAYVMATLNISLGAIGPKAAPLYAQLRTDFSLWVIPTSLSNIRNLGSYIIIVLSV
jgi:hypothetical protein